MLHRPSSSYMSQLYALHSVRIQIHISGSGALMTCSRTPRRLTTFTSEGSYLCVRECNGCGLRTREAHKTLRAPDQVLNMGNVFRRQPVTKQQTIDKDRRMSEVYTYALRLIVCLVLPYLLSLKSSFTSFG